MNAQSSFGLSGYWSPLAKESSMINSFESNPSNFSKIKDWGLSLSYGSEFATTSSSNIYSIVLTKRISAHTFSLRYTPGYQKEFSFVSDESIAKSDSSLESLSSKITYKELFGFGYSYKFTNNFSGGFSFRYFNQEFDQEVVTSVFSDTVYLSREDQVEKANFWRGDIGINYTPYNQLTVGLSTINLINIKENTFSEDNSFYEIKRDKGALFSASYAPLNQLEVNLLYETTGSLQSGFNANMDLLGGNLSFGFTAFHDKYQTPYFAGIVPSLSYTNNLFGITISGVKYFSDRNTSYSFSKFENTGISNIINNNYSYDKAIMTVSIALNTISEQKVNILDVKILDNLYPTLSEQYVNSPFAIGKVVNLTNKPVSIKPFSKIEGVNIDKIQSPVILIAPKDTVEVPFYTIIPEKYSKDKAEISYADFYLATADNNDEAQLQKPLLIDGVNAWDGKVKNLKYFVRKDNDYSMSFAKNIVSEYKTILDTLPYSLSNFYKAEFIFNKIVKNLVYTSDPTATADYVQFPHQTIKLKGGDCDDLSVLYSSLLSNIGIETAFVDYKPDSGIGHVNLLVNTGLFPEQAMLITKNDTKYYIRKNSRGIDEVWIPIETTSLTNFDKAWDLGAEKFNRDAINHLGLVKGKVNIVDVN